MLAVPFKGKERLRQFLPVDAGCNDRKQDRSPDVHQRRRSAFRPEGFLGQAPDVALTGSAQRPVFRAAAHAVHGDSQREEIGSGTCHLVG
jgi:hypothetical protein